MFIFTGFRKFAKLIQGETDSMKEQTDVLLVGIGGYGSVYADAMLDRGEENKAVLCGVVEPRPEGYGRYGEIMRRGIPVYDSMDRFYETHTADLTVISSPIHHHKRQTVKALEHGSNVLCEKPMCAGVEDGYEMIRQRDKACKMVNIGYQWSFSEAVQHLKKDIISGVFGKPLRMRTAVLWPRSMGYYSRNDWAGKIRDTEGNLILDSVANNATAHYLNNMLFVLGSETGMSAMPATVRAELYRANDIETFDTCAIRIITESGTEIFFVASHAVSSSIGPEFIYEFENAEVRFGKSTDNMIAAFYKNGASISYGDPVLKDERKLWDMITALRNGGPAVCPPESALPHTICINAAHASCPDAALLKGSETTLYDGSAGICVEGLFEELLKCYEEMKTPSDMGYPWSVKSREAVFK